MVMELRELQVTAYDDFPFGIACMLFYGCKVIRSGIVLYLIRLYLF